MTLNTHPSAAERFYPKSPTCWHTPPFISFMILP